MKKTNAPFKPMDVRVFSHAGSPDHEFQDAANYDGKLGVVAVSDGATISICQREWAEILTGRFVSQSPDIASKEQRGKWWEGCVTDWMEKVNQRVPVWRGDLAKYGTTLRLFHRTGASATFLGFHLKESINSQEQLKYSLYAVGDTCAFWFRNGDFVSMEPKIAKFNFTPPLLNVRAVFPEDSLHESSNEPLQGDMLVLATDAIAEYLSSFHPWEQNPGYWEKWWTDDDVHFESWTESLKSANSLKPDDYTMVLIRFKSQYPSTNGERVSDKEMPRQPAIQGDGRRLPDEK